MKKFYFLIVMLFTAVAVNATTIKGDVYKWSSTAGSTAADEQIEAEVTLQDGVVTFSSFLNSGIEFIATVSSDGSVTDNQVTGTLNGSFSLGSFGNYESLYLYAGYWSYPDFTYYVSNGVKTLHFGAYAGSDWFDIYFYLPDDFEPYDPYADKETFQLAVTFMEDNKPKSESLEFRAYVENNVLNIIGLFGRNSVTTYSFTEDLTFTSNLPTDWTACSYDDNGTSNTYLYFYGTTYLAYDAESNTASDYVWLYESNRGGTFIFSVPEPLQEYYAGISNTQATAGSVEYYNLQGVRVSSPQKGISIKREGNKVQKVLIK